MAHTSTNFAVTGAPAYGMGSSKTRQLVAWMFSWFVEERRVNRTVATLSSLSDATLKDIGIDRGDIAQVARYGKDALRPRR